MKTTEKTKKGDPVKEFNRSFSAGFCVSILIAGIFCAAYASGVGDVVGGLLADNAGAAAAGSALALIFGGVGAASVLIRIAAAVRRFRESFEAFAKFARKRVEDDAELKDEFSALMSSADELTETIADLLDRMRMKRQAQKLRDVVAAVESEIVN